MSSVTEYVDMFTNANGKTVYRYMLNAETLEGARAQIPGDYLEVFKAEYEPGIWVIEIVRTF